MEKPCKNCKRSVDGGSCSAGGKNGGISKCVRWENWFKQEWREMQKLFERWRKS